MREIVLEGRRRVEERRIRKVSALSWGVVAAALGSEVAGGDGADIARSGRRVVGT